MKSNRYYDVVVIGAGIHGVGVAQAAAAAGYKVLVLEQASIAAGTSSRSSKLIHGGLRYLEQWRFGLVRECLRERELLLRIAPDLVKLRNFVIPVYRDAERSAWKIQTGLYLYSLLSGFGSHSHSQRMSISRWPNPDGLKIDGLRAVFQYQDAQTDDAGLTRSVMASAESLGAELLEAARFMHAEAREDGCAIVFEHDSRQTELRSRVLVNAAGPWVSQVAASVTPATIQPATELIQGAHIVLNEPRVRDIYYVEAPQDGRAVFVMSWKGRTLVGTTETQFGGADPAVVSPTTGETDYLKEVVAHYFPGTRIVPVSAFAGLRVLPRNQKTAFGRSRELMLVRHRRLQPHVLHLYGGKLTSYRADAQRVLDIIRPMLPKRKQLADTRQLRLDPG